MNRSKEELLEELAFYKEYIQQLEISREIIEFEKLNHGVDDWYQRILKTMNEGFSIRDQSTRFTYVNDKFCDMLGYSRKELLGFPIGRFVDQKYISVLDEELKKRKAGLRSTYELNWLRKDGTQLYTILSAAPLFDDAGRYVGGFGIMTDITPRRLAEKKLEDYQNKLRSLASELSLAEERERRRIAAELHDRIGQSLATTKIKLGVLGEKVRSSELFQEIVEIRELIDQTIKDTRSSGWFANPGGKRTRYGGGRGGRKWKKGAEIDFHSASRCCDHGCHHVGYEWDRGHPPDPQGASGDKGHRSFHAFGRAVRSRDARCWGIGVSFEGLRL